MLPKLKKLKKNIYLDYAATTPLEPKVEQAMRPFLRENFGNPSSLYEAGRKAKIAIEFAREQTAKILNCKPAEIVFTAGGTESANLAILGVVRNHENKSAKKYHIITTSIEHHAVLRTMQALEKQNFTVTYLSVGEEGIVNLEAVKKAIRPETILVSVMYANNEIGTIQPIEEIGRWLKAENTRRQAKKLSRIYFHADACQAAGALSLDTHILNVDLLTLNGSKIYGPKQTGCLYGRAGVNLKTLIYGGGQEKNLRSGTENVPGIVGFAAALSLVQKNRIQESKRLATLRDYFFKKIKQQISNTIINGSVKQGTRLPNNINIAFNKIDGEALLLYLDSYGIAVSTGSACSTNDNQPSHVLKAIGRPPELVTGSLRLTLGASTTKQELDYTLKILVPLVKELRVVS